MESIVNILNKPEDKKVESNNHKLVVNARRQAVVNGVNKAISANETCVVLQIGNIKLFITGHELHLDKLDAETGLAEIVGNIEGMKYSGGEHKKSFFKRIFG